MRENERERGGEGEVGEERDGGVMGGVFRHKWGVLANIDRKYFEGLFVKIAKVFGLFL